MISGALLCNIHAELIIFAGNQQPNTYQMNIDWKKILSNWIVRNVLYAVLFLTVLLVTASIFLNIATRHGKTVEVPNDGFGPVANEQFDMIKKALSGEDEEEGAEGQTE